MAPGIDSAGAVASHRARRGEHPSSLLHYLQLHITGRKTESAN